MSYPGGKAGGNTPHRIINQMPPHSQYVEAFLGAGAIMRAKRPAACSIGIDSDEHVVKRWAGHTIPGLEVICGDALDYLTQRAPLLGIEAIIYLDPPPPCNDTQC